MTHSSLQSFNKIKKIKNIIFAGVDEAGRGCLAGPVVAASVILSDDIAEELCRDSKQLSENKRVEVYEQLMNSSSIIGLGVVSHRVIDRINILQATFKAMIYSIKHLSVKPDRVFIDGNRIPPSDLNIPMEAIVKGDSLIPAISAASIIAKVTRDRIMASASKKFKHYQFEINKGYGTDAHYESIFTHGPSSMHRHSFNLTRQESLF